MLALIPFGVVDSSERFIGAPAALASFIVVAGALVGGPRVGLGLALVCGALFDAVVISDRSFGSEVSLALVLIVWVLGGIASGLLGDRYRDQVARSLGEAHQARAAVQRVLDATPAFHAEGSPDAVARAVCAAALETFGCDFAALFDVEDGLVRLLAKAPRLDSKETREAPLERFPELSEDVLSGLQPSFVADVAAMQGPSIVRDLAGATDQVATLRMPVLLGRRPIAVFTLAWDAQRPAPTPEYLAVAQRFVEHAAVAIGQARQAQAQREVTSLYRRFQANLVPLVDVDDSRLRLASLYEPGEKRMLLGGDFVDVVRHDDGNLSAVVGDVTGHGPDAAAMGSTLRAAWQALTLRRATLDGMLATLNELTLRESERAEAAMPGLTMLATVCAIELDPTEGSLTVACAGHPQPILLADGRAEALDVRPNIALGVEGDGTWLSHTIDIGVRPWSLLLYTDGLIEARRAPGSLERVGTEGLAFRACSHLMGEPSGELVLEHLVDEIRAEHGGPFADDVTLLLVSHG
jgi:serine phosphatase RsbU (regulator of sigma subunit)